MDELLDEVLREVQAAKPDVIPESVKVDEEYSCYRYFRRGATTEAQNTKIPKGVIETNNKWRKYARRNGMTQGMSMMDTNSDAKSSVPTLIRFCFNLALDTEKVFYSSGSFGEGYLLVLLDEGVWQALPV